MKPTRVQGWRGAIAWVLCLGSGPVFPADQAAGSSATVDSAASVAAGTLSGDLGAYSDYIARGLSYTSERPSFQGHFEFDWTRGPYIGLALNHYTMVAGAESVEIDPYGGYMARFDELALDAGIFSWFYPAKRFAVTGNRYNTVETYFGASYKGVGVKFWYELTDYFGLNSDSARPNYGLAPNGGSRGSRYVEANFSLPLPHAFTFSLHAGRQWIRHYDELDFTDWLVGIQRDLVHGFVAGVSRTDTTADPARYADSRGIDLGRGKWLVFLKWAF